MNLKEKKERKKGPEKKDRKEKKDQKKKKIEPLLQWLSQFLSGLATCVGYAWSSGDQPRRLLFTWPSRGVSEEEPARLVS